jgi:D-cysteine desulfhydrase
VSRCPITPLDLLLVHHEASQVSLDALDVVLPAAAMRLPRVTLGQWPTPIEPLSLAVSGGQQADLYVKREDLSSPMYGGNKVRCLEPVFFALLDRGVQNAWASGAFGSNQAVAIAMHAPRVGLAPAALLFPQPSTQTARENLLALAATGCPALFLRSLLGFPWAYGKLSKKGRRQNAKEAVIPPGAAVPLGALGHLAAALEVALDVDNGLCPPPKHVVLPIGSTCTTAGLLLGFSLAAQLGIGFAGLAQMPTIHAVRISPWPVTARFRILRLTMAAARLLARKGGPLVADHKHFHQHLHLSGAQLGRGYGHPTQSGIAALTTFGREGRVPLDTTYSSKGAAYLLAHLDTLDGPTLFWSTKSKAPLPVANERIRAALPRHVNRWLTRQHASERLVTSKEIT